MFSKNTYLIPQVSSCPHPRTTSSVVDLNGVEILLHHHHPDMFTGHYSAANNAPLVDAATLINQDDGGINGDPSAMANSTFQRKQAAKKDRHSKIHTAQGPRDRRVRLSIGIARKFFDLQEMLGFDKPSKTLDWLLTKSRAAIKELVQKKQYANASAKSSSSPSECELHSSAGNGEVFENGADSKRKFGCKDKGAMDPQQAASDLAKESRAKARARARERTREKMCIKQFNGTRNSGSGLSPTIPVENRNNQLEPFQSSAGLNNSNVSCLKANAAAFREPILHCPLTNEAATQDLIEESIVIKRKSKSPSFFGFQQNVIVSRDLSSNYITPSVNATENWDVCSFTSQSNLYAINLDQHKFINSNSNIRSFWNPQD